MIKVGFKRLHTDAKIPTKGTKGAAGFDVYSPAKFHVEPGLPTVVGMGFSVEIPEGYCMRVIPRSGIACRGLTITNSPGLIDSDYKGELKVIFQSAVGIFGFDAGDRVCQITFEKVIPVEFEVIDELSESERGEGGLGSTKGYTINE